MGYTYNPFEYEDYKESEEVKRLRSKKSSAEEDVRGYRGFIFSKQGDYDSFYKKYKDRDPFSYDFNADALYQQYKDKYIEQGKMAMADTMGQAAAMTGGYGNSYAASVGNQAYQKSLENLNDIIPELYQMARDKYDQDGQDMLNMMALLGDERDFEYGKWGDGYNRLVAERDYIADQYDSEWNRDYGKYESDRDLAHDEHTNKEAYNYQNYLEAVEAEKKRVAEEETKKAAVKEEEDEDDYLDASLFKDYDAGDWEAYFANIRQTEGSSAANEELNLFTKKGLIPTNMVVYAAIGARGKLGH